MLQKKLRAIDCKVVTRNFGKSGDTTTQMIARFGAMTQFSIPDIGIIFGGVNDPGNSISQATTQANIQNMIQTLKANGVAKILVVSAQYQNFSSGGDTLATPYAAYVPVRQAQQAAASAENVVFVDLYNFLRNRIVNGLDTQGSFSWHYADGNQHFNAYGEDLVAQCILASIQAQGWDDMLV
jgi:lysophospholipase L1-like esterase